MLSKEEKKAIEYYSNKEVSFSVDFDTEKLLKALGITEEDSFENHQIRFKTLLNLITKLQKENELAKEQLKKQCEIADERNDLLVKIQELQKQIDLMAEVMFKNNTAQLIIEYGIENKEQIIKEFEKLVKEKGE